MSGNDGGICLDAINIRDLLQPSSRFLGSNYCTPSMVTIPVKNMQSWQTEVMQSDIPVFVDFWAEWCGPCRMVSPVVDELSEDYAGKVKFVKVNVSDAQDVASEYNITSIPTLSLFNKGHVVTQQLGSASKESYKNMIDKALG